MSAQQLFCCVLLTCCFVMKSQQSIEFAAPYLTIKEMDTVCRILMIATLLPAAVLPSHGRETWGEIESEPGRGAAAAAGSSNAMWPPPWCERLFPGSFLGLSDQKEQNRSVSGGGHEGGLERASDDGGGGGREKELRRLAALRLYEACASEALGVRPGPAALSANEVRGSVGVGWGGRPYPWQQALPQRRRGCGPGRERRER